VHISTLVWAITSCGLIAIVAVDLLVIGRRKAPVTPASAARWIAWYVGLALIFSLFLLLRYGATANNEFLASYATEYSLSADNLFVFMILIARFQVPAIAVDRVLYLGIVTSMILRGLFIAAGSAAISRFNWVFYLFGAFLLYTAIQLAFAKDDGPAVAKDSAIVRTLRRRLRTTDEFEGDRFRTTVDGRRMFTPIILVIGAIAVANVVFALDSIPAVFGITKNAYLVLTANAFALMGLRQLYFLIGDLLQRLVYLNVGLSVLLGFIGIKLIFEALHGSHIHHVGSMRLPTIDATTSLAVVVGILGITAAASLLKSRLTARD
jgi:TerC family integral membrane protein